MSKVSNIISSYVVSVYNGQIEGIVNNILFNNKKQAKYLVISQNDEQFLVLETKDIYKTGEGAVIVKNSDVLSLMESSELKMKECFSPINSIVVSIDGNYIGHVSDIELDNKYNIKNFIVDGQVFDLNKVINISESAIIINTLDIKTSLSKFKSKTKIVMGNERITNQTVSVMSNQTILPNRTMLNYNFLIGRKVSKDILNFNGEIIIKENQTVNSKVLDIARINGKLRELIKVSM
ncbi:MAG: hypothetical protein MR288_02700 [Firmicutes bacterium]|nr:hypothetical protein [Bacillota bacterium]MDY5041666.1 hypothetical protein [Eubacteriales bacterium]